MTRSTVLLAFSLLLSASAADAAGELPAGYTAVDYLVAPSGAYIDTEYTANGQTKVVFDAVIPARWEQKDRFGVLFGSRTMNDFASKAFALQMCTGNSETLDTVRFVYNGAYRQDLDKPFSFGERVTVTCDCQHVEWTGSKAASVAFDAAPLASSKSTLYIFADNTVADDGAKSETGVNPSVMRLYSFKIYEGWTLKRDFVPAWNDKDERGLFDRANNKFYPLVNDFDVPIARVPAIAVPKGAFIDTGIKPDSETRVTMDVLIDRGESFYGVLEGEYWFGCWDEDYNKGAFAFGNDGTGVYAGYGNQGGAVGSIVADGRHTVELDGNKVKVDGADYYSFTNESFALKQNLYLFAQNRAGKVLGVSDYQTRIICMGCRIYHGGKLVRDFVPARTALIGGPYGLYDRVERVFYRNANPVSIIEITNSAKLMYRHWDKNSNGLVLSVSPQKCTFIDKDTTELKNDCWYAAVGDATLGHGLTVDNSVHLILADGCYLETNGRYDAAGIEVEWGTTNDKLHIYGQEGDTGRLVARGGRGGAAGIGGRQNSSYGSHCGNIYIHGGKIEAHGWGGAGIGGGVIENDDKGGDGPAELEIYGGEVFADTVFFSAGIGGGGSASSDGKGGSCGSIAVFGGVVEASGSEAGIGPGYGKKGHGKTMNLKISGGRVFANGTKGRAIILPSSKDLKIEGSPVSFWNFSDYMEGSYNGGAWVTISREPVGTRWNPLRIGTTGSFGLPNADVWAYLDGDCLVCDGIGSISASAFLPSVVLSGLDVKKVRGLVIEEGITAIEEKAFAIIGIEKPVKLELPGYWPADDRPTLINVPWRGGYFYTRTYTQKITSAGPLEFTAVVIDGEEQKELPASGGSMDYVVRAGSRVTVRYRFAGCLIDETRMIGASGPDGEWIPSPIRSVSYLDAGGNEQWTNAVVVTELTDRFENGRWYVVTGEVSRGGIDLPAGGTVNLILADGASLVAQGGGNGTGIDVNQGETLNIYGQRGGTGRLTATGGRYCAAIGGGDQSAGGDVAIFGGMVTATGGDGGAAIGGGWDGSGGTVTIAGGVVTATGGRRSAAIGGGDGGSGGIVTINGGTVTATRGLYGRGDIGGGFIGSGGEVTIGGGSIKAAIQSQPHNGKGQDVYCVIAEVEGLKVERLEVHGLRNYGTRDIVPIDGKVYLYLPNGMHSFSVSDGSKALNFYAVVNGRDTTVESMLPTKGFFVNGSDIGSAAGTGWNYGLDGCLHFTESGTYVLSGLATNDEVQVSVDASDAKLVFSNAVVYTQGRPSLTVGESLSGVSIGMAGNVSYLAATNVTATGESVPAVLAGSASEIFLAPGGERLESMICIFNFGDAPAVDGVVPRVSSGSLCVWADEAAARENIGYDSASEIMAVGDDPGSTRYATESTGAKCVLVAPLCRVLVPEMPGLESCTVSNREEGVAVSKTVGGTNVFTVMEHDSVTVRFIAAAGYEIVSGGSVVIPAITNDVLIGSEACPAPDVRQQLTVTLPETLEGATYVVTEDGGEVEGEVEGDGKKVYPVRSGYDVEIVCTAQDGWRLVSESNVVAFANIRESQVLAAADLPQAWRLFTVTVPAVANAASILTSTDVRMADTGSGVYTIISNAEVTVMFLTDGNYHITANGEKTWTLTGDVTFGTTDGFPLPTVEGIPGTISAPWTVGENVRAYTNSLGVLTITGTGAMSDFTNAEDVPWDPDAVIHVAVEDGVVQLGANSFAALDDAVTVNGTTMSMSRFVAPALGPASSQPSGSISGAEFERIDIVDGVAYLGVSVYTNSEVKVKGEGEGWGVATNGVIEVPAPGKQGFFYLMSKPAAPSNFDLPPIVTVK